MRAHARSSRHRAEVEASVTCGCFYCLATFPPSEVRDWWDGGDTAVCPRCGIDAVIGSASGFAVTDELLRAMRSHWF